MLVVLVPYKITLLSNNPCGLARRKSVLVPYKITLLSNLMRENDSGIYVLVPYKITLLSNFEVFGINVAGF